MRTKQGQVSQRPHKPRFRVGQVVAWMGYEDIDGNYRNVSHHGTFEGIADGSYKIKVCGETWKVNSLRELTVRERGKR